MSNNENEWAYHFVAMLKSIVLAGIVFGGAFIVSEVYQIDGRLPSGGPTVVVVSIVLVSGIFFLKAFWHAIISVLWPLLLFIGVVGAEVGKAGIRSAKQIDEGGLKSIVNRIWYGKNGGQ